MFVAKLQMVEVVDEIVEFFRVVLREIDDTRAGFLSMLSVNVFAK